MRLTDARLREFQTNGFVVLRGLLEPAEAVRCFRELREVLTVSYGSPVIARHHRVPAMDDLTPLARSLARDPRFVDPAEQALGRSALGEGTDASLYVGDTPWHHDAVHDKQLEAVKFTLYGEPLREDTGALRLVPGSHQPPLQDLVTRLDPNAAQLAGGGVYVFETEPGDAVLFDVRVRHGSFGGSRRLAGSVNFRIDPRTDQEIEATREYFRRSHRHFHAWYEGALYPASWRGDDTPGRYRWAERLAQLGAGSTGRVTALRLRHLPILQAQLEVSGHPGLDGLPAILVDGRPLPLGLGLRHLRRHLRVLLAAIRAARTADRAP